MVPRVEFKSGMLYIDGIQHQIRGHDKIVEIENRRSPDLLRYARTLGTLGRKLKKASTRNERIAISQEMKSFRVALKKEKHNV